MKKILVVLCFSLCCFAPFSLADDAHDHPMPAAEQLGTVNFPVSCSPDVQKPFARGLAMLHSFWYEEAEKQFEQIAAKDPHCAMAHWGIAISLWHQLWDHPDAPTIARGQAEVKKAESLHAKTARERDYIAAIAAFYRGNDAQYQSRADAYSAQMRQLYQEFPDDKEAGTFFALSLLASEPEGVENLDRRKEAVAVLQPIFDAEPDHPGVAHYLIHACDSPEMAKEGLPAAERYSKIAPASAHAVHMPSHIYARLGLWQEDIEANQRSVEITRKDAAMGMGGEAHQFHAMDFLMYAYLQSGRDSDALKMIEEVKTMPATKPMYGMKVDPHLAAQARYPAFYTLEVRHWAEAAVLTPVAGAGNSNSELYWARAIGAARSGNPKQGRADLEQLEALRKDAAAKKNTSEVEFIQAQETEAQAWMDHASGHDQQAIDALAKLAQTEDAETFRNEVSGIPAREMLADMLLELNRPEQALLEYQTDLKLNPNRFNGLYGAAQAAEKSGKQEQANEYYSTLVRVSVSGSDRPELQHAKALLASK